MISRRRALVMIACLTTFALSADGKAQTGAKKSDSVVKVTASADKPDAVKVAYPAGKQIKDKIVGDYNVYEDKAVIKAVVQRPKGDASPLEVTVKLQACSDQKCLLPATVKLTVP